MNYDAFLLVSFGGPEHTEDVLPFLENVLRGRNVPRERMLAVAEHYYHFGGKSPINDQNRALIAALKAEFGRKRHRASYLLGQSQLASHARRHPAADESGRRETRAGICYFGVQFVFQLPAVPREHCRGAGCRGRRRTAWWTSCACSTTIHYSWKPTSTMCARRWTRFRQSGGPRQRLPTRRTAFRRAWRRVATTSGNSWRSRAWYPTRSAGRLTRWCSRAAADRPRSRGSDQTSSTTCAPFTPKARQTSSSPPSDFVSDHMEVLYDLDTEAAKLCRELGLNLQRAATAGTHPKFVRMVRELVTERMTDSPERVADRHLSGQS